MENYFTHSIFCGMKEDLVLCFYALFSLYSFLRLTTLIGLCPTLYHRVDLMLLLHQVRKNSLIHMSLLFPMLINTQGCIHNMSVSKYKIYKDI